MNVLDLAGIAALAGGDSLQAMIDRGAKQLRAQQHTSKLYGSAEGPMKSAKPRRPAGMSGRQWKRARKAASLSTKSEGFYRTTKAALEPPPFSSDDKIAGIADKGQA